MTRENLISQIGAKTWSSFSDTDFNGLHIISYILQFYNKEWIYGYAIYNRDMEFPMYGVKDNMVCLINNEDELKAFGEMAKRKGTEMFTNNIVVNTEKEDGSDLSERIRTDKSIITIDIYDEKRYVYSIGTAR